MIGEDQALLRAGLALVLNEAGFEVVATAADAPELEHEARAHQPDLVVADIRMPPGHADDGLQAALRIRAQRPGTAILVLSQHVQPRYATDLLAGGAHGVGYLLKQRITDVEGFSADARRVASGGSALDAEVIAAMVARHQALNPSEQLTPRQREVLALMAEGRSNAAIAERLTLSEKAVVKHVSRIYDELGLPVHAENHRRVLAVVRHLASS